MKQKKFSPLLLALLLLLAVAFSLPTQEEPLPQENTTFEETATEEAHFSSNEEKSESESASSSGTSDKTEAPPSSKKPAATEKAEENKGPETTDKKEEIPSSTKKSVGTGKAESVDPETIPPYSGSPFIVLNDNVPNFSADELTTAGYETYSALDRLGRTGRAVASVGKETMPKENEKRSSISSIKPSGWKQAKYDGISGGYLYNRCHLIGWQLSAENANEKNLLTGTRYMNVDGMLPFENMVADYIKETQNHVAYRITPIYRGNDLLATGVQMEAYSVEDDGDGICFHVFCYNVQPNVNIRYEDGSSSAAEISSPSQEKPPVSSAPPTTATAVTTSSQPDAAPDATETVYVTKTGKKYHSTQNCPGLANANAVFDSTLSEALAKNLSPCSKCH